MERNGKLQTAKECAKIGVTRGGRRGDRVPILSRTLSLRSIVMNLQLPCEALRSVLGEPLHPPFEHSILLLTAHPYKGEY